MSSFCARVHLSQGDETTKGRQAPFKQKLTRKSMNSFFDSKEIKV